jgi:hypothetical protein
MGDLLDIKTGKPLSRLVGSEMQCYPTQKTLKFIKFFAGFWFGTDYVTLQIVPGTPPTVHVVPWSGSRDSGYAPVGFLRWVWLRKFARKDPGGGKKGSFGSFVTHLEKILNCRIVFARAVPVTLLRNSQIDKESK